MRVCARTFSHSHSGKCNVTLTVVSTLFVSPPLLPPPPSSSPPLCFFFPVLQLCIPSSLTLLSSGASQRGGGYLRSALMLLYFSSLLSFLPSSCPPCHLSFLLLSSPNTTVGATLNLFRFKSAQLHARRTCAHKCAAHTGRKCDEHINGEL